VVDVLYLHAFLLSINHRPTQMDTDFSSADIGRVGRGKG